MQPSPPPPPPVDGAVAEPVESREVWLDDLGELPHRPRRRWLAPAPLSLLAVLLTACGFIAGVLVEKGQNGSSGGAPQGAAAFVSRLRAAAAGSSAGGGTGAAAGTGESGTGGSGAGGSSLLGGAASGGTRPTTGTVSYSSGHTLYVTDSEGNTVQVKTSSATSVTKSVKTSVRGIRPGETVTVIGNTATNGSVTAETIRVGSSGGGLGLLFGGSRGLGGAGGSSAAGGSTGSGATGSGSTSGQPLFGN